MKRIMPSLLRLGEFFLVLSIVLILDRSYFGPFIFWTVHILDRSYFGPFLLWTVLTYFRSFLGNITCLRLFIYFLTMHVAIFPGLMSTFFDWENLPSLSKRLASFELWGSF